MGSSRRGPRKGEKNATVDVNAVHEASTSIGFIEPIVCQYATLNVMPEVSVRLENCDVLVVTSPVIHTAEVVQQTEDSIEDL